MPKINTNDLYDKIKALHADLEHKATQLKDNPHYTDEGKASYWQDATKRHAKELQELQATINNLVPTYTNALDDMERDYYDTARIPKSELMAAELGAARIMGRGKLGFETVHNLIQSMSTGTITGADIIVVNEAMARGVVTMHDVRTTIGGTCATYEATYREATRVQTLVNNVLAPLAQGCEDMITNFKNRHNAEFATIVGADSITGPEGIDVEM